MTGTKRRKRKIVSRLTGDPDIVYFDKPIDNKVALLRYKSREVIVEKRAEGYVLFTGQETEYMFRQRYIVGHTLGEVIEEAKKVIKDDDAWEEVC